MKALAFFFWSTDLGGRPFNFLLRVASGVFPCVAALGFGGDEERDGGLHGDWFQVGEVQIRLARGSHVRSQDMS